MFMSSGVFYPFFHVPRDMEMRLITAQLISLISILYQGPHHIVCDCVPMPTKPAEVVCFGLSVHQLQRECMWCVDEQWCAYHGLSFMP